MGADGQLLLRVEAIAGATHEGVLGDQRIGDVVDGVADLGVAVGTADIGDDAELLVEVVGAAGGPGDLVVALEILSGAEAEVAAATEELVAVGVGLLDGAFDAGLAVGVGLAAGAADLGVGGGGCKGKGCDCKGYGQVLHVLSETRHQRSLLLE